MAAGDQQGYKLYTMDHSTGHLRLDLEHKWASSQPPQPVLPPPDQLCDDEVFPWRICTLCLVARIERALVGTAMRLYAVTQPAERPQQS